MNAVNANIGRATEILSGMISERPIYINEPYKPSEKNIMPQADTIPFTTEPYKAFSAFKKE